MKTLKHCLIIFIYAGFITSYAQTTMFHPKEGKVPVKSVNSNLLITPKQVESNHNPQTEAAAAALAAILPAVIETGITIVKSELKKREESFSAEYNAQSSGESFWLNDHYINLPNLKYTKQITKTDKKDDAINFTLEPFQSADGMAFRYKLTSLKLDYSEARVNGKYPTLNLQIDIKFSAFVKTDGKYTKTDLGQSAVIVNGVGFGSNLGNEVYYTGWFPILPREESSNPSGNYEIEVTVKEVNPGQVSAKKISKFFEDNGEKIQETSKIIIENIFPKEEEKAEEDATATSGNDGGGQTAAIGAGGN